MEKRLYFRGAVGDDFRDDLNRCFFKAVNVPSSLAFCPRERGRRAITNNSLLSYDCTLLSAVTHKIYPTCILRLKLLIFHYKIDLPSKF